MNYKRTLFSAAVTAAMMGSVMMGTVSAADPTFTAKITVGNATDVTCTFDIYDATNNYVMVGNGSEAAISKATSGAMTLPDSISDGTKTYTVKKVADGAFQGCTYLTTTGLAANKTIESIGAHAYEGDTELTTTGLSTNKVVTSLGTEAFKGCSKNTEGLNATVKTLDTGVFYGNSSLTESGLANTTITALPAETFYRTALKTTGLEANKTITTIGDKAYSGISSFTTTGLEKNTAVTTLGEDAFSNDTALTATGLEANATVTTVGDSAYYNCSAIKTSSLPATTKVASLGSYAFNTNGTAMTSFTFNAKTPAVTANTFNKETVLYYAKDVDTTTLKNAGYTNIKAVGTTVTPTTPTTKVTKPAKNKITSLKSKKKGQLTVKYSKAKSVAGYTISYKKSGAKKWSTKTTTSTSCTLTGLSRKKKYSVKVRSYRTSGTSKVYSSYSATRTAKTK